MDNYYIFILKKLINNDIQIKKVSIFYKRKPFFGIILYDYSGYPQQSQSTLHRSCKTQRYYVTSSLATNRALALSLRHVLNTRAPASGA